MNLQTQLLAAAQGHITTSTYKVINKLVPHSYTTKPETLQRLALVALSLIRNHNRPLLDDNHL